MSKVSYVTLSVPVDAGGLVAEIKKFVADRSGLTILTNYNIPPKLSSPRRVAYQIKVTNENHGNAIVNFGSGHVADGMEMLLSANEATRFDRTHLQKLE